MEHSAQQCVKKNVKKLLQEDGPTQAAIQSVWPQMFLDKGHVQKGRRRFSLYLVLFFQVTEGSELVSRSVFICCWQQLVYAVIYYFPVSGLVQLKESLSVFFNRIRKTFLLHQCDKTVLPTQIFN